MAAVGAVAAAVPSAAAPRPSAAAAVLTCAYAGTTAACMLGLSRVSASERGRLLS